MAEGCHERPAVRQITLMMMMLIAKGGRGLNPFRLPWLRLCVLCYGHH